ncbi:ARM repeat-containing protein [Coprinopsis marcescibilis]|uniref:ARM repeat-containing protein n=1 Tax=Coprinopsis marcescibilis TaxID=230819 RepID=A0A5C3LAP3_COPMA|nr:ARM repeat-containing protein [Coprinopsis marcescibilis]
MVTKSMDSPSRSPGPASITLPPPPVFSTFATLQASTPDKSPSTPLDSYAAFHFYTAPSSPTTPPVNWFTPPTTPKDDLLATSEIRVSVAPHPVDLLPPSALTRVPQSAQPQLSDSLPIASQLPLDSVTDDTFPAIIDLAVDLGFGEDGLNTLEKIYLYSRSESSVHRVFIIHKLPAYLDQVTPQEAIEYVLPLINSLALDDDEVVKEALAAELVPVIWWFFSHCQIIPDDPDSMQSFASTSSTVTISVQAFTPILGTLLLSSSPTIVGSARFAVVNLLARMKRADDKDSGSIPVSPVPHGYESDLCDDVDEDQDETLYSVGMFKKDERSLFRQEILHSVVIGMGRLDLDPETDPQPNDAGDWEDASSMSLTASHDADVLESRPKSPKYGDVNPYFPAAQYEQHVASAGTPTTISSASSSPPHDSADFGRRVPSSGLDASDEECRDGDDDEEQAAIGRLSSMSLMAAVTAAGSAEEDVQRAFVTELERIGRDSNYFYVRSEASLALGALAKVVPEELVLSSLLPLFDVLRWDSHWRVRHSALYALPAILPRLSPNQRRTVALETVMALSCDVYGAVRSSVLESLGEVLYTFHNDPGGPPPELIQMFLGRVGDSDIRRGVHTQPSHPYGISEEQGNTSELFFTDPERPLICAFNFPAVVLTLGKSRWPELKSAYADLAQNRDPKVRKTLAASVGQLAKIIGKEATTRDLVPLWWDCVRFNVKEVRIKSIEALETLLPVLSPQVQLEIVTGITSVWVEGAFAGWRERATILALLNFFVDISGRDIFPAVQALLLKGLEDSVAAVRDAAVHNLPSLWRIFSADENISQRMFFDLEGLASSPSHKRRMTFVACAMVCVQQEYHVPNPNALAQAIERLARDPVVDVRIGIARLLHVLHAQRALCASNPNLVPLIERMRDDPSQEVRTFLANSCLVGASQARSPPRPLATVRKTYPHPSTFSRPPPLRSASDSTSIRSEIAGSSESLSSGSFAVGPAERGNSGDNDARIGLGEHGWVTAAASMDQSSETASGPTAPGGNISTTVPWTGARPVEFMVES